MKKIIKIEIEVEETTDKEIRFELERFLKKIQNFCKFHFNKGDKAKITIANKK